MHTVELLVKLKIPDVTALTAANALRRRMGYSHTLKELTRAHYYRLELDAPDPQAALGLAKELADSTNLFVNPNKHYYEVRPATRQPAAPRNGQHVVQVLVLDPTDDSAQAMLAALQGRLGYGDRIRHLLRGVLWTLTLQAPSAAEARQMAQDIAVTRSRDRGLLANPHFQQYEIW